MFREGQCPAFFAFVRLSLFVSCLLELDIFLHTLTYIRTNTHTNRCCCGRNAWCNSRAIPPDVPWEKRGWGGGGVAENTETYQATNKNKGRLSGKEEWLIDWGEGIGDKVKMIEGFELEGGKEEREKDRERSGFRWLIEIPMLPHLDAAVA